MTVTLQHLRSLTNGASSGAEALGILFDCKEFHPNPGRRQPEAEAICKLIKAYLALKSRHMIELALVSTAASGQAVTITAGRGKAGELIAELVSLFTTDRSSVPMLGFDMAMMAPFRPTNGPVGDQVRDAWWITITADTLSISGRTIWDREI